MTPEQIFGILVVLIPCALTGWWGYVNSRRIDKSTASKEAAEFHLGITGYALDSLKELVEQLQEENENCRRENTRLKEENEILKKGTEHLINQNAMLANGHK